MPDFDVAIEPRLPLGHPGRCTYCAWPREPGKRGCAFHLASKRWDYHRHEAKPGPRPTRDDFRGRAIELVRSQPAAPAPSSNGRAVTVAEPATPSPKAARELTSKIDALRASHARIHAEDDGDPVEAVALPLPKPLPRVVEPPARDTMAPFSLDRDAEHTKPWAMQRLYTPDGLALGVVYNDKGRPIDVLRVDQIRVPRWARGLALLPDLDVLPSQGKQILARAQEIRD